MIEYGTHPHSACAHAVTNCEQARRAGGGHDAPQSVAVGRAARDGGITTPEEYDRAARDWTSRDAVGTRLPREDALARIDAFLSTHTTCALATGDGTFMRCTPQSYDLLDADLRGEGVDVRQHVDA